MENKIMKIVDENDNIIEYTILDYFYFDKTNKNYIVYTDNKKDSNGKLNVYASIYYKNDNTKLDSVDTSEEWDLIEKRLKIKGIRG